MHCKYQRDGSTWVTRPVRAVHWLSLSGATGLHLAQSVSPAFCRESPLDPLKMGDGGVFFGGVLWYITALESFMEHEVIP